jgi:hypothetical protein
VPSYRNTKPKITWGAAFANTLNIAYPLDAARSYALRREGSEDVQDESGNEDAWVVGIDHYLEGLVRWIPRIDGVSPEGNNATGWEGATGWRAALAWLWDKNVGRYYMDASTGLYVPFYLVEPIAAPPESESNFTRRLEPFRIRSSDGTAFDGY